MKVGISISLALALALAVAGPALAQDKPDEKAGQGRNRRSASPSDRAQRHLRRPEDPLHRDHRRDHPSGRRTARRRRRSSPPPMSRSRAIPSRPVTFLFNGGPGSGSVWLQMGAFGPKRVAIPSDARDDGAPPYPMRRQSRQPARRHRPRLHRPARHRLQPSARQDRAQGILRRHRGRQGGRPVHPPLAQRQRPLEQPQISRRRKLRHHPLRGGRQPARGLDLQRRRPERRHPHLDRARFRAPAPTRRATR